MLKYKLFLQLKGHIKSYLIKGREIFIKYLKGTKKSKMLIPLVLKIEILS